MDNHCPILCDTLQIRERRRGKMEGKEIFELDIEWAQLISEALHNGITEEEIREFLRSGNPS